MKDVVFVVLIIFFLLIFGLFSLDWFLPLYKQYVLFFHQNFMNYLLFKIYFYLKVWYNLVIYNNYRIINYNDHYYYYKKIIVIIIGYYFKNNRPIKIQQQSSY
jgi:hypothetical protein